MPPVELSQRARDTRRMLIGGYFIAALVMADGVSVTESVHAIVSEAASSWSKKDRVAVITIEALSDGRLARVDESYAQPVGSLATLTAAVLRVSGGVAPGEDPVLCASRIVVTEGVPAVATACLPDEAQVEVFGWEDAAREGNDASRDLFAGFSADADGAALRAIAAYRRATNSAPKWALPALAFGLALARVGRMDEAKPLLERWAKGGGYVSPEVRGYVGGEAKPRPPAPTVEGSAVPEIAQVTSSVAQCERDPAEVTAYVQQHLPKLVTCVQAERGTLPPALPVVFVVRPSGEVAEVGIDHRHFRKGELSGCVARVLTTSFAPSAGGDCPSRFEIAVKTLSQTEER
jgi:hypothetical protein